ncbi:class II aldolase/adducin family protein [Saccharopolyspora erythraea]|uniref:L-fuculose-phosphate aldolase n=2 Tax=Saccharopolyspora erythraea TaxID=1836 RepID=A4FK81_SACEN|nr:class II aldolase/adducin family protein [Saccharopolyspora erythraea]EQD85261.1 fuculose phosphate aldolase [Saccharopolyspora erythraea D]QRK88204.1 class II aldolase/adducin family protein [Saccharopolyspora erythraea]CAM04456.1 L-fuculose-phosphate aldolase [Saccharopolyspora erythraea NRRL 2338]
MNEFDAQRREVIDIARRMTADGLVVGTSGNVSVRCGDLVAVTPSGVDYDDLVVDGIPLVDLDGTVVSGSLSPTSELPMHLTAYREHDAQAVVHTHSLYATALSLLRDDVPAVHYQLADFGGSVVVADYATFGSDRLAETMSEALEGRAGCILRNHGTVTIGKTLAQAYNRARQLEWLCQLWLTAAQVGTPRLLDDAELASAAKRFSTYGQSSR